MLLYFSASSFHVGCSLWQWPHLDIREANRGDLMHYGKPESLYFHNSVCEHCILDADTGTLLQYFLLPVI